MGLCLTILFLSTTTANSQYVVINEIEVFEGDDGQYVELFGDPSLDLGGLSIALVKATFLGGGIYEAQVSNITDYGCFAQLEEGIEGLIHLSELDWTSKNIHPSKVVEMEENIKVMILEIDNDKRRISLGLKQTKPNPWTEFANKYGIGDKVEGSIKSITDFGIFVGLEGDIDGLIHLSDISEEEDPKKALEEFKKDQNLQCIVFAIDADRERISLKLSE